MEKIIPNSEINRSEMEKASDALKRKMWLKGVPPEIRAEAWKFMSGNPAALTEEYYDLLVYRGTRLGQILAKKTELEKSGQTDTEDILKIKVDLKQYSMHPGKSREDSICIIENDLPRTFPTVEGFIKGQEKK